jgi:hypothetical protein
MSSFLIICVEKLLSEFYELIKSFLKASSENGRNAKRPLETPSSGRSDKGFYSVRKGDSTTGID